MELLKARLEGSIKIEIVIYAKYEKKFYVNLKF